MAVLSEEYLNKLTPNHLGVKKKIQAGFINISKDTMKHLVLEDFILDYPLFVSFTVDDVKAKLDSLYPGRDFFRDSLRGALWVLVNEAFPHRLGNQKMYGQKGRVAKYFLTSRIKKIKIMELSK